MFLTQKIQQVSRKPFNGFYIVERQFLFQFHEVLKLAYVIN